ncbi:MAG: deoxyhypusine synthase [Myxococcales bacterium]|nr:deoxyhypusine synthase [Myxococcales bacterium]
MKHDHQGPPSPETSAEGLGRRTLDALDDGSAKGLVPLTSLDPLHTNTATELLRAMAHTSFGGRRVGEAADILYAMTTEPSCRVIATLSGAMTVAKMSMVIVRMIQNGMIDAIVSTGALMSHGLSEGIGLQHYKVPSELDDEAMYKKGYNRVYDTLELESNLNSVEAFVRTELEKLDPTETLTSERFCRVLGEALLAHGHEDSILGAAAKRNVPVYIPAFTDCEVGLDVATWAIRRAIAAGGSATTAEELFAANRVPAYNPFGDLLSYARFIGASERIGIFTIGGGVPRNWAQQVGPFFDLLNVRLGLELQPPRFHYGVRICPEPVHWGGLSGCTYSEGVSWGKFVPEREGGRYAEVHCDATAVWPLIVRGVLERLGVTA